MVQITYLPTFFKKIKLNTVVENFVIYTHTHLSKMFHQYSISCLLVRVIGAQLVARMYLVQIITTHCRLVDNFIVLLNSGNFSQRIYFLQKPFRFFGKVNINNFIPFVLENLAFEDILKLYKINISNKAKDVVATTFFLSIRSFSRIIGKKICK